MTKDAQTLRLSASIGLTKERLKKDISIGEGVAGQSALSGKEIHLEHLQETDLMVDFTGGSVKPKSVIAIPVFHEKTLKGVLEL